MLGAGKTHSSAENHSASCSEHSSMQVELILQQLNLIKSPNSVFENALQHKCSKLKEKPRGGAE